ncbi:uncharacterized protein LOC132720068 [Ruditapes philippinarum]|uniref:uncharacterized protein LOC132720068 n=1 Tax=Ruditapes philippinarum TaxID=129788 RepID=UPI00295B304D|nr:uncharacterized protein LOC132720068 [Ruditapes philippinarum]
MEDIEELAESKDYENYKSVDTALSLIGQCLEPYTVQILQSVHDKIKQKLAGYHQCNQRCSEHYHYHRWCPTCSAWRTELTKFLQNPGAKIKWRNMKSWSWPIDVQNISEVFLPISWKNNAIHLKDISTALSIWTNCSEFPLSIVLDINPIKELRNDFAHKHKSSQKIGAVETENIFITMFDTLKVPDIKAVIPMYTQLKQSLKKLRRHGMKSKEFIEAVSIMKGLLKEKDYEKDMNSIKKDMSQIREYMKLILVVILSIIVIFLAAMVYPYKERFHSIIHAGEPVRLYRATNKGCLSDQPYPLFPEAIRMHGYISKHSNFVGREWLFERLERRIEINKTIKGVLIIADMGFSDVLREHEKICIDLFRPDKCEEDPIGCMNHCLISPLMSLRAEHNASFLILVDALDECDENHHDGGIAYLLKSKMHLFPSWIHFILTCRKTSYCSQLTNQMYTLSLNSNDSENQNDLKMYFSTHKTSNVRENFPNFLLATFPVDMPTKDYLSLDIFYEEQFRRHFGDGFESVREILEILCASFEALEERELQKMISHFNSYKTSSYEGLLYNLSEFIHTIKGEIHLWHSSLKRWLINTKSRFKIDVAKGHHYIASYILRQKEIEGDMIDLVNLVLHAALAEQFSTDCLNTFDVMKINEDVTKHNYPLHRLARRFDNFLATKHLIKHFPNLEQRDSLNVTPIFVAATHGNLNTLRALVQAKSNTNFRTHSYMHVIHLDLAIKISLETHHWDYGILDISAQNGHLAVVKYIVENLNYNLIKMNGMNLLPIHLSCKYGHVGIVKYLYTKHNWTIDTLCLYFASENGHVELVSYLLEIGIEDKCKPCKTYLHFIPRGKSRIQGTAIISTSDEEYRHKYVLYDDWNQIACETALHVAVRNNHFHVVKLLMKDKFSKNTSLCFDRGGRTPLMSALQYNRSDIAKVIFENMNVNLSSKSRKPIHVKDITQLSGVERKELNTYYICDRCTIIHVAAYFDRSWFVKYLIDHHTELPDVKDNAGCHPAHVAACVGSTSFLNRLLEVNSSQTLQQKCDNGSTPLESAASCNSIETFNILMKSTKQKHALLNKEMRQSIIFKALNGTRHDLQFANTQINESTPINESFALQILDAIEFSESDLDSKNMLHQNILHIAMESGQIAVINRLFSNYLDRSKHLITEKDRNQRTPIDLAIERVLFTENVTFLKHYSSIENSLTPVDYVISLSLDFIEKHKLFTYEYIKQLLLKLLKKNCSLVVNKYLRTDKRFHGDNDFVKDVLQQDSSTFVSSYILMLWYSYRIEKRTDISMCINNCQKVTQQCHMHTVALKYGEIINIYKEITNADLSKNIENIIMMDFRLNALYPDMLSTCNDEEGYNVLERSIQGRSVELVKFLLGIGVKSYKRNVTDLIKLAIYTNKADRGVLVLSYPIDTNTSLIKVIRKSGLMTVLKNSNHVDFLRVISEISTKYNKFKRDDSGAYKDVDIVVSTLVNHYHGQLLPKNICSPNSTQFSLVHIAAMHGLTLTLSNISTYFGVQELLCPNYHSVTPLFLAQLLNQKAAAHMLSSSGSLRNIKPDVLLKMTYAPKDYAMQHSLC